MLIGIWQEQSVAVLSCRGRLDLVTARKVGAAIDELLDTGGSRIVVDLSETTFIDSSGLSVLVSGLKRARHAAGDLRIAGAGAAVMTVLNTTNLDRLFGLHATVEDALAGW